MARVTFVKKAQQRYETRPVLDDKGQPIKIALTKGDGSPKMTSSKGGKRTPRPVFITKTEPDKTRPKPNYQCGKCQAEILPGQPYKWIKPKSGPYGGRLMVRCGTCPTWQVWDYSNSLSAQVARIEHDATSALDDATSAEDVTAALNDAASSIRDLAEQKRESASNMEEGFGHATYQSEDLEQQGDNLEGWADEVEAQDVEDLDVFDCAACTDGQAECPACDGTGEDCADCDGTGEEECSECDGTGNDLEAARESWSEAVSEALGNCPV